MPAPRGRSNEWVGALRTPEVRTQVVRSYGILCVSPTEAWSSGSWTASRSTSKGKAGLASVAEGHVHGFWDERGGGVAEELGARTVEVTPGSLGGAPSVETR